MSKRQSYWEMLRDPRWQKRRLEVMQRARFECENCGDKETTFNVHHAYYEKGKAPWEYPDDALSCLCEPCHKEVERLRLLLNKQIGRLSFGQIEELLGYAMALEMLIDEDVSHPAGNFDVLTGMMRAAAMPLRDFNVHMDCAIEIAKEYGPHMTGHDLHCAVVQAEQCLSITKDLNFKIASP